MQSYLAFLKKNARPLLFGGLHSFYSAPGQTFSMGVFVAYYSADLGIGPAAIGAYFMIATLASAAMMIFLGHFIDSVSLPTYSGLVVASIAVACFVMAVVIGPLTLIFGLFLLRITGQGLMTHVEATATARAFAADRGRALGVTGLGIPAAQTLFPAVSFLLIDIIGWRGTYAAIGVGALLIVLPVTQWLIRSYQRHAEDEARPRKGGGMGLIAGLKTLVRSRYVWMVLPTVGVMPFYGTAMAFHVSNIAVERGYATPVVALAFMSAALSNVVGMFIAGFVVDRFSARRMLLGQAVPAFCGYGLLSVAEQPWMLPICFFVIWLSAGLSRPTLTAIWAEKFGTEILGTIRSAIAVYFIIVAAMSPLVFGTMLQGLGASGALTLMAVVGPMLLVPAWFAEYYGIR